MQNLWSQLISTEDFPARWHCGSWTELHGWVHICADVAIFGAYAAIPVVLIYFILKRKDVPFLKIFWLFSAFILACGTEHLIEATIFWHPWYRLSAALKVVTALVSWITVVVLVRILPKALEWPGILKLNQELSREVEERRRAENLRKITEDRFSRLVNSIGDYAIYILDATGRVVSWNWGAERLFQYSAKDIVGRHYRCLFQPEHIELEKPESRLRQAAAEKQVQDEDWRRRQDGSRFWGECLLVSVWNENGQLEGFSGVVRDLTERHSAEQRVHIVIDAAPNAMIMVDSQGKITLVNTQTEQLFGYSRADLIGQSVERLIPERYRGGHPGHRSNFLAAPTTRAMGAGRDLFGLRKDGVEVPIEIGLNPVQTDEGAFVLASVIDITERKRAEAALRASEARKTAILEAAPNAMIMVDSRGKITLVNAQTEQLFGYSRADLIGQSVERLIPERYRGGHPGHRSNFHAAPTTRAMGAGRDLFGLRKDGVEVPIEIGLNPVQTDEGAFVLASVIDITERKQTESQRQAALDQSEMLLKEIHHRVKNNLQVVSSLLSLQARRMRDTAHATVFAECRDRIRAMALIHERLYTAGHFAAIEFGSYLSELVRMILGASTETGGRILLDLQLARLEVNLETAVPLSLIANELVVNALKHAFRNGRAGTLTIKLKSGAPTHELTVQDDGPGLPSENTPKQTTGIGFELVEILTRQVRGEIHYQSSPTGTKVSVRWPAERQTAERSNTPNLSWHI